MNRVSLIDVLFIAVLIMFSFTCVNKGKQNACYSIHVHFFIFTSSSCNDTLKGYPYRSLSRSVVAVTHEQSEPRVSGVFVWQNMKVQTFLASWAT